MIGIEQCGPSVARWRARQVFSRSWPGALRLAVPIVLLVTVSGCSSLIELPGSGPAPRIYDLSLTSVPESVSTPGGSSSGWRLHVDEPDAPRALNTDKVVLRKSGVELQYYKDARWSDRAPSLVQRLLVDALDRTGAAEIASADPTIARGRYSVKGYLRSFEAQYGSGAAPRVVVRLKLVMADQLSGAILSVQSFESSAQSQADEMRSIVEAMNEAANAVVADATPWMIAVMNKAVSNGSAAASVGSPGRSPSTPGPGAARPADRDRIPGAGAATEPDGSVSNEVSFSDGPE